MIETTKKGKAKLLSTVKERFKLMSDADHENRLQAMEDMKFVNVPGEQWDENMKIERGNRPCYEFNKLRPIGKRIINDMRANRPSAKVRAVEGGDIETAEIEEGLIRNIWNISDGETITDYAAEYQVNAGMAGWRVTTKYADDSMFEQDIMVEAIQNPFCLYCDPSSKDYLKRDAEDWILTDKISKKAYKHKYPNAEESNFDENSEFDNDDWEDEESVRIAEYWYKEPHKKEIWQLDDGTVVDGDSDEANSPDIEVRVVKRREVMTNKIYWCIVSGSAILEGPTEWAGTQFPFVMVFGEYIVIDGKTYWWGLPRFAKDAQRSYNVARTAISETIAQAPKSKFWATQEQAKGLERQWSEAHKKNYPFMLYNPDPKNPGPPVMMYGPDVPVALIQESQLASEELKAVTGIYDASMGAKSNEQSGRAIYARQQQGEIVTFNFQDNMAKGMQRTYEIILDLIPHVYDTERELRILGNDGAEDYVRVNQVTFDPEAGRQVRVNDLSKGKFDVTITVGPSFATLRQEAAETYGNMANVYPELMGIAGDLVFKSMDMPYADEIAERLRTILPPQIQEMLNQGKEIPPEAQQAMQQAAQAMQQVQQHGQLVQEAAAELEQEKALAAKDKAEIKAEIANIKTARAEFDAHVAGEMLKLVQKETGIVVKGADLKARASELSQVEGSAIAEDGEVIRNIDQMLATFMQAVDDAMGAINEKTEGIRKRTDRKPIGGVTRREGGKIVADVEYDDGTKRTISAVRENGQLKLVPDAEG